MTEILHLSLAVAGSSPAISSSHKCVLSFTFNNNGCHVLGTYSLNMRHCAEYFANIISFDAGKESNEIGTIFTCMQK